MRNLKNSFASSVKITVGLESLLGYKNWILNTKELVLLYIKK